MPGGGKRFGMFCWPLEGCAGRTDRQITGGLGNIARAFAHRNYLVYVSGNSISLIGWWLERVAVGWLTWTLTHSGAWLGLIALADFLPVFFLAPFAGVLADRRDRVRTIRLTQWIGCAQASLLAILVVSDAMTIESCSPWYCCSGSLAEWRSPRAWL